MHETLIAQFDMVDYLRFCQSIHARSSSFPTVTTFFALARCVINRTIIRGCLCILSPASSSTCKLGFADMVGVAIYDRLQGDYFF